MCWMHRPFSALAFLWTLSKQAQPMMTLVARFKRVDMLSINYPARSEVNTDVWPSTCQRLRRHDASMITFRFVIDDERAPCNACGRRA